MNLFIDTNIIIDLVADRKPFSKWSYGLFKVQKTGTYRLYTSSSSILTCYYIIEKHIGSSKAQKVLKILLDMMEIQEITKDMMLSALTTKFKDYEVAVQHECAKSIKGIEYIVTRNKKDFKHSNVKIITPEELLTK